MKHNRTIDRGDVWYMNVPIKTDFGSVQNSKRPCLIISCKENNRHSTTVNVLTITTTNNGFIRHIKIHINGTECYVQCEQFKTVDIDYLERYMGTLDKKTMDKIDKAIAAQLELHITPNYISKKDNSDKKKTIKNNAKNINIIRTGKSNHIVWTKEAMEEFIDFASNNPMKAVCEKYKISANTVYTYRHNIRERLEKENDND